VPLRDDILILGEAHPSLTPQLLGILAEVSAPCCRKASGGNEDAVLRGRLIRLANELPAHSEERKALLSIIPRSGAPRRSRRG
jgi:hypothetical protein